MPIDKSPWTDDTLMPWGDHKGTALKDVPAIYKAWLLSQKHWIQDWPGLASYLRKHHDVIMKEAEETEQPNTDKDGYDSYEDYQRDVGR